MNAGRLRHRVTIQYPESTPNEIDEPEITWQDLTTVWAAIEPLKGTTYFAAKQANMAVDGKITMRHRQLDPTYRLKWTDEEGDDHIFTIVTIIQPQQRTIETQIYYKESL